MFKRSKKQSIKVSCQTFVWHKYVILSFLLFGIQVFAIQQQKIPSTFKKTTDSLIINSPKTYDDIDSILRPFKYDTILMRYFVNTAIQKKYFTGQSYGLNQLGAKYRNTSEYKKAISLHSEALEASIKAENLELRVFSLNMLSVVYRRMDAIKTALDFAQEALELAEKVQSPTKSIKRSINISLNSIGNIYQTLKQFDLAIETFQKSLLLEEKLNNTLGLAINNQNIGECYEALGQLELALNYYRKSLAFNEDRNNEMGRLICNNSIAQIYIKQNKLQSAIDILKSTLNKSIALGDIHITSSVYINLGWALKEFKHFNSSEANLMEGIRLAVKHNIPGTQATGYTILSELYELKNDSKKSLFYFKKAKEIDNELTNSTNVKYVNDILFIYDAEKKNSQILALARENELVRLKLKRSQNTFLISALVLALLALLLYILYRQYQLKNEKKLLTLQQSMLRSQMNPHFLFNSLNSIKNYIVNNEQKNAVYYLNKFSKLVRKILESSSLKEIPLAEELETVELYMNIENMRFSNEISFKIDIEEGIDTESIKIPSLILQPFLENAIWHGLSSKEGNKSIRIEIKKENDYFTEISIYDNGIGREAAEVIKTNKVLKRKSIGIDITKERLANFSKDYANSFEFNIEDLFDNSNRPKGTKVTIHIPTI